MIYRGKELTYHMRVLESLTGVDPSEHLSTDKHGDYFDSHRLSYRLAVLEARRAQRQEAHSNERN